MWVDVALYEHDTGAEHFDEQPMEDKINLLAVSGEIKKRDNRYEVKFIDGTLGYLDEADYEHVEAKLKELEAQKSAELPRSAGA